MNTKQLVKDLLAVKDKAQVDLSEAEEDLDYIIAELNLATNDSKLVADLIEKWDSKRVDLLHWRKAGVIPGGIDQSKLINEILKDLKGLA